MMYIALSCDVESASHSTLLCDGTMAHHPVTPPSCGEERLDGWLCAMHPGVWQAANVWAEAAASSAGWHTPEYAHTRPASERAHACAAQVGTRQMRPRRTAGLSVCVCLRTHVCVRVFCIMCVCVWWGWGDGGRLTCRACWRARCSRSAGSRGSPAAGTSAATGAWQEGGKECHCQQLCRQINDLH